MKMGHMCLNWRVIAGLVVVGLGILVVAPNLALAAVPLLLVAICPLSMLLMMRGMHGGKPASQPNQTKQPPYQLLSRSEQLETLHARLASLQTESESLSQQIAKLETTDETVARHAEMERREVKNSFDLTQSILG